MRSLESLDLSNNQLSGEKPEHLVEGCISLAFLVLSNNSLQGQIFSKNFKFESLDLSYNYLNGKIHTLPLSLLSYTIWLFSVWPIITGNLLLCGLPLPKSSDTTESPSSIPGASTEDGENSNFMDMDIFYISFTISYVTVLLVIGSSFMYKSLLE